MKKKHRDIEVDGLRYGWTVNYQTVKIWYDKKVIAKYDIPDVYDITPKIVAGLISDPKNTMMWINAESCPFCGVLPVPSEDINYLLLHHEPDCWFDGITPIKKSRLDVWNKRH